MATDPDDTPATDEAAPPPEPCQCRHLRSKGMYVYTDGLNDNTHEDYDNTIYWCLLTMKGFGPDDGMVERPDCYDPSRSCHEPI